MKKIGVLTTYISIVYIYLSIVHTFNAELCHRTENVDEYRLERSNYLKSEPDFNSSMDRNFWEYIRYQIFTFFLNNSYLKFIYFLKKIIFFYDRVNLLSVYITAQILLSIWLNRSGYFTNFQKKLFVYLGALRWSRQSSVSSKN